MAWTRRTSFIALGAAIGVMVLTVVAAPIAAGPRGRAGYPTADAQGARVAVVAYFAATTPIWMSRSEHSKPSGAQIALPHTAGTERAITGTNAYIAKIKSTMQISKATVSTEIVKTSVIGPGRVTTISNVTTDWTLAGEGGEDADAAATVGHQTTTVDTPVGAAVVSDVVLSDS